MKRQKWAIALALLSTPFLGGCGSNSDGGGVIGNNPGTVITYPTGTCVPIQANVPIVFAGSGIQVQGSSIMGGVIPSGQTIGTITVTGTGTPPALTGQVIGSDKVSGTSVRMTVAGTTATGTTATTATLSGYILLGQQDVNLLTTGSIWGNGGFSSGYPYTYPYTYPSNTSTTTQSLCVSGIALSGYVYQNGGYQGYVILYFNSSTTWAAASFTGAILR